MAVSENRPALDPLDGPGHADRLDALADELDAA